MITTNSSPRFRLTLTALAAAVGLLCTAPAALASGPASAASAAQVAASPASLATVTVSATDVVGGTPVTGTVTLTAVAPAGGLVVTLTSDNPQAAAVAASITVAAGSKSATFAVSTNVVPNPQSALIIGNAGQVTTYAIVTVRPASQFTTGGVSIIPGGTGRGTVTSQPAGINCVIGPNTTGTCSASFPAGTVVKLTARAGAGSKFDGWRGLPGCGDPSRITVARGTTISCQPSFSLK